MEEFDNNMNDISEHGLYIGQLRLDDKWIEYHRTPEGNIIEVITPLDEYLRKDGTITKERNCAANKTTLFTK